MRDEMNNIERINIYSLVINDISLGITKSIVSETLQRFIHILIMAGRKYENDSSRVSYSELKCLSICQDIFIAFSYSAKKLPKHILL